MIWFLKNKQLKIWLSGLILFLLALLIRWLALNQTPYANGWDGYYYVMQAHSWLTYHHLQSPDYSLIYPYYIALSYFLGQYELAYKMGAALLSAAFSLSCFLIIYKSTKNPWIAILAASITIFSPGITFFTAQFPKNLLGLLFLCWLVYFAIRRKYIFAFLCFILCALAHRMTAGLGLIVLIMSVLPALNWKIIVGSMITLITFSLLPGILHISDMERFNGAFNSTPILTPYAFIQLGVTQHFFWWILEIICICLALLGMTYQLMKEAWQKKITAPTLIIAALLFITVFPFFRMDYGSMGYRFFLISPFILPFTVIYWPQFKNQFYSISACLLVVSAFWSKNAYQPYYHDAPNKQYIAFANKVMQQYSPEQFPLIIAHKGLAEVIIYKTEFDALNWAPPPDIPHEKVLRIVHNLPKVVLKDILDDVQMQKVMYFSHNYSIMPETLWDNLLSEIKRQKADACMQMIMEGNNPIKSRPQYLKKGKTP